MDNIYIYTEIILQQNLHKNKTEKNVTKKSAFKMVKHKQAEISCSPLLVSLHVSVGGVNRVEIF